MRFTMPLGGCRRWPYPELPAGEVQGRTSESRREKLPHLLSASGGRRGRAAPPAGLGERCQALQLSKPSVYHIHMRAIEDNFAKKTVAMFASPQQGQCASVSSINDRNDWKTVKNALQIINIDDIDTNVRCEKSLVDGVLHVPTLDPILCSTCLGSSRASSTWGTCSLAPIVKTARSWMTRHSWTGSPT